MTFLLPFAVFTKQIHTQKIKYKVVLMITIWWVNIYKGLSHNYQGLGASVTCHGPWIVEQWNRGAPQSGCRIRGLDGLVGLSQCPNHCHHWLATADCTHCTSVHCPVHSVHTQRSRSCRGQLIIDTLNIKSLWSRSSKMLYLTRTLQMISPPSPMGQGLCFLPHHQYNHRHCWLLRLIWKMFDC